MTESRRLKIGDFCLDKDRLGLFRRSKRVELPTKAFEVLCYLADRPGQVISKQTLLAAVWGGQRADNTVEQAIRQIRRALGDEPMGGALHSDRFLEGFQLRGEVAPGDAGRGEAGQVDGDAEEAGEGDEAADVVGVFVGDEDGVEGGGVFADGGEAVEDFAAAEARVNEQAGAAGGEKGRVAGTAACKYAELDDAGPPGSLCRARGGEVKGGGPFVFLLSRRVSMLVS